MLVLEQERIVSANRPKKYASFPQHFIDIIAETLGIVDNQKVRFNKFYCNKKNLVHHHILTLSSCGYLEPISTRGLYSFGTYKIVSNKTAMLMAYFKKGKWSYLGILKDIAGDAGTPRKMRKILAKGGGFSLSAGFPHVPDDREGWFILKKMCDLKILLPATSRPPNGAPKTVYKINGCAYSMAEFLHNQAAAMLRN